MPNMKDLDERLDIQRHELQKQLSDLNCPYLAEDPRSVPWLEGYAAGYRAASDQCVNTLPQLLAKLR